MFKRYLFHITSNYLCVYFKGIGIQLYIFTLLIPRYCLKHGKILYRLIQAHSIRFHFRDSEFMSVTSGLRGLSANWEMGRSVEEKSNENRVYWIYQCVLNLDVSQLVCASQVSIYVAENLRKKSYFLLLLWILWILTAATLLSQRIASFEIYNLLKR